MLASTIGESSSTGSFRRLRTRATPRQRSLPVSKKPKRWRRFIGAGFRFCPEDFVALVKRSRGMLLFVSADRTIDDVTILEALGGLEPLDGHIDHESPPAAAAGRPLVTEKSEGAIGADEPPWNPANTPAQVRLVDLLQALRLNPFARTPFRIAVIVSAWDLVVEDSAEQWLSKKLPLLDQFLRNREIATQVRAYGVAAQGGPLSKKGEAPTEERARLLAITPASKRIKIVGHETADHDLTHPIHWLCDPDKAN